MLSQQLYLVVSKNHPLVEKEKVCTADFVREPMIMLDERSNLRRRVKEIYDAVNAVPNEVFEVRECNAALQFVAREMGISILPPPSL